MTNPLQFSMELGGPAEKKRASGRDPLRILLLSDLGSTCRSRSEHALDRRPMKTLDIDALDDLLAKEAPTVVLPAGTFSPKEIDDFHADHVLKQFEIFQTLKDLRSRLKVPSMFDAAAAEVRALLQTGAPEPSVSGDSARPDESDTDTLARLFGQSPDPTAERAPQSGSSYLDTLLRDAVASHIVHEGPPEADQYIAAVDAAAAAHLRAILRDPGFQQLERAWRGVSLLASGIETDEDISIHLWNVSAMELIDALGPQDHPLDQTVLHRRIIDQRQDEPFTLIVPDLIFDPSPEHLRLLASLGAMAGRSGALVLAGIEPHMIGAPSWSTIANAPEALGEADTNWAALCSSPMGQHIVALGPRFLMRSPYGKRRDPVDAFFDFDEMPNPETDPDAILWGSSALIATMLIAQSFDAGGWSAKLTNNLGYDDLPLVSYEADGEQMLLPCAEVLLADRVAEAILAAGPVPVVAVRNQNAVRLPWLQPISGAGSGTLGPFSL